MKRWVFTHHKCASNWTHVLFDRIARALGLRMGAQNSFPYGRTDDARTRAELRREIDGASECDVCHDANARFACVEILELACVDFRAVHVVRDPRDVLVSAYFSHRDVHPTDGWAALERHRERLRALPVEEGLIAEIEFMSFALEAIAGWDYEHPLVMTVRYESMVADVPAVISAMVDWLRLPIARREVEDIARELSFEHMRGGRPRGVEDPSHHYRKGVAGDWRSHFTPRVERAFLERWRAALAAAGYVAGTH